MSVRTFMLFFAFLLVFPSFAQVSSDTTINISKRLQTADSLSNNDTTTTDSIAVSSLESRLGIKISKDALPAIVVASATDSAVADIDSSRFFLYGDAKVKYEEMELAAAEMTYNQSSNLITAKGIDTVQASDDTTNAKNTFIQGSEKFTYDWLQYNFKSKRAIVRNARTQYGEGFIHSEQIKRNPDESIYGLHSIYTTCNLDTPHFGIRANRIKVVPERIIVSGSANLTIQDIPTPLYLPFGVFPISDKQRSGFQLPSYTLEERRGLGLTNLGYYFYLNEYVDLLFLSNIYSKGSYNLSALSNYTVRYKYSGKFSINYGYEKNGEVYESNSNIQRSYRIMWQHATDPKAKPGQSFSANVDINKNNYTARNSYNSNEIIKNQYLSNLTYSKSWQNKPYGFSASARYEQNTATKLVNFTLPQLNFYVSQVNPFQRKKAIGSAKWYEKITASYNINALARTSFYDTAVKIQNLSLTDFNYGISHKVPISAAYTVLRYVNLSFGIDYNEYWLTEQLYRYYNSNTQGIDTVLNRGFYTARDASANMQLSTRIYGMKLFRKGKIAGIRHVLTPNIGINYIPNYAAQPFNYYYRTYTDASGVLQYASPYQNSVIGIPGSGGSPGKFVSALNFGLNNNLQMKVRTAKDTAKGTKIINLIDGLSINGNYNFAADSFKLSTLSTNFRTAITNIFNVSAAASFDPYVYDDSLGRRINKTMVGNGGGVARFTSGNIALSSSFKSKQQSGNQTKTMKSDEYARLMRNYGYNDYIDFNVPWSLNVTYSLSFAKEYRAYRYGGDTLRTTDHNLQLTGDFNLTPRWKVTFRSGYNFVTKQMTITSIDIYRDLHCWEMRLGTIPFGPQKSYNFTLNVKASVLQDLRLLRRRDYRDAVY